MNSSVTLSAGLLYKAMRNRWRTAPASASMTLAQGLENANFSAPTPWTRVRLSEEVDPDSDYDPTSSEPRYLQMAKAAIARRRDMKCQDCGFVGLPASVDGKCPECGGLMEDAVNQPQNASATTDEIRAAIRKQAGQTRENVQTRESVHASLPGHNHDIHMTDLLDHYGYKANGNHYVFHKDPSSKLTISSTGHWIHEHHGVKHEGHGHKSLAAHLQRYHQK